jgi:hypothetical protein
MFSETPLSDPAYYLVHPHGEILDTTVQMPGEERLQTTFLVFADVEMMERYLRLAGQNPAGYRHMRFDTLEEVERFVNQYRDRYEFVMINPELGQPSAVEPFERLLDMARELAGEE